MCGISGILLSDDGGRVDRAVLAAMVDSLRHRGPDASGHFHDGPVALGHNRLAVIDLTPGGAQPMTSADGRATVVFNGEIYNFRELRAELEARGAAFRSRSDTEVILEAWRAFGADCLGRLEGMFAFALWDHDARTLLVARDRLGVKPLAYARTPAGLAFGSEVKALRPFLGATEIDPLAFHQVLLYGFAPSPGSLVRGVQKLPPGHAFVVRPGDQPRPFPYWRPTYAPPPPPAGAPPDPPAELRDRLTRAVRRQLVSDVPVGAFLSGGLDSSVVVGLMAQQFPDRVNTFAVGGRGFAGSELPHAKRMADHLGVRHHAVEVDRAQFLTALSDVAWHNDEPTADPALVPLYVLSKFARQHVTVALCGEGADELFAGYAHYPDARRRLHRLRRAAALPAPLRRAALGLLSLLRGPDRAREFSRLFPPGGGLDAFAAVLQPPPRLAARVRALLSGDGPLDAAADAYRALLAGESLSTADPLEARLRIDTRFNLADFLLTRADNMAMASGLEARVPFLDEGVVEFATRLPGHLKLSGHRGKAVLRDAFAHLLPPEIAARPKAPFPLPLAEWVLGDAPLLRDTLLGGALVAARLLDAAAVSRFLATADLDPGRADYWDCTLAWRLLYLEVWARRFINGDRFEAPTHARPVCRTF